jgi:antitoxin (DNA-binding transcriptional repressor) of toxin-antitoxin stability system
MREKVSMQQLLKRLPEVLDRVSSSGEEYVVQRNGKDCAVIVNAQHWRRRQAAHRLDAVEGAQRLSGSKQARAEELLALLGERRLKTSERRELDRLLRECDAIMLQRAAALKGLP